MSLKGKVAIVTGGNSGIARVIVLELARLHANIVIDYVCHPEATEALEQQVGKLGDQSIGVKADVSRLADLRMDHWAAGLSNGYTTFFLSPEHGEGFYWGVGPVLYYPSATNSTVGVNKWGSGPSAAFIKKDESPWVFGAVANNIWSVGGPPGSSDRTNQLLLNPFLSYHFAEGWSVGSSPNITTNWIASGGKWTVPVGGGFGKAVRLGEQPIKLDFDAYYNVIRPKAANETWLLQVTVTFQFPD
jgi:hypothetical protein